MPEIESHGATLVAISPQTPTTSADFASVQELDFPVLSDFGSGVAVAYGLAFVLPESVRPLYSAFGISLPEANGDESHRLPLAATYVLDRNGVVTWAYVSEDYTTRAEPRDVLAALEELASAER